MSTKAARRIAVLTSGGDAPGMNPAIRAVVRQGIACGCEVLGVRNGYRGLVDGDMALLGRREVGGIIHLGGTILGSARLPSFAEMETRAKAIKQLRRADIESLIVIGGNGSQRGAAALCEDGYPVVGIASTIDNDLVGTDISLGVNTALDVALEAIDRLKTTAASHHRAFLVETMGRDCGYLALAAGIAGGAEAVVVPEFETSPETVAREIADAYRRGKDHAIVVVAEGAKTNADDLARHFEDHHDEIGFGLRVTKLGYVQRGGAPTAFDRLLGTRLGAAAVETVFGGTSGCLIGLVAGRVSATPYGEIAGKTRRIDAALWELAKVMAR